ncbi:MAG: SPOR domain-containing protein, partial [Desulfatibacillaceae bacterium]|nr:SPOR domain-containing protein [Desulfatibacillaceae bacterium]
MTKAAKRLAANFKAAWPAWAIVLVLAIALCPASLAAVPAVITNQAWAAYEDEAGRPFTTLSNVVRDTLAPSFNIRITPDGTQAAPGQTVQSQPLAWVNLPYLLENTGNSPDSYSLALTNLSGDDGNLSGLALYMDTNGNGKFDLGEPVYDNSNPPLIAPGAFLALVAYGQAPLVAGSSKVDVNLAGFSISDSTKQDNVNVSRVMVSDEGSITASKSADATSLTPGRSVNFTILFSSQGNTPVQGWDFLLDLPGNAAPQTTNGILVSDNLPQGMTYAQGSVSFSSSIPNAVAVFAGADGIWRSPESKVNGPIFKVGLFLPQNSQGNAFAGPVNGSISFEAVVDAAQAPGVLKNRAQVEYAGASGKKTGLTNEVPVTVKALIRIVVDDTDDDGAHTGSGVLGDPDDTMHISHAAAGSTVSAVNEAWNLGSAADVVNLAVDVAGSVNWVAGIVVSFTSLSGIALMDSDGDGLPDTGLLAPGERREFITQVSLPANFSADGLIIAVKGISGLDNAVTDLTFVQVDKVEPVGIRVEVGVSVAAQAGASGRLTRQGLANVPIKVYEYANVNNPNPPQSQVAGGQNFPAASLPPVTLVRSKVFRTDEQAIISLDEFGAPFPLFNWMRDGHSYTIRLGGEYSGYTYYSTPPFYSSDFLAVNAPGEIFVRGSITVKALNDGTKLLVVPLDPAGFVYDAVTGARVDGACVTFYRCNGPACDTFSAVDESLLDFYPDGITLQENNQISGASDRTGLVNTGKGPGAFEFQFANYIPNYDGWYFIGVDFACNNPGADPALADKYAPVGLKKDAVWNPYSGNVYSGEKFYIDKDFPGAILLRMPLMPADFSPLKVEKAVSPNSAEIGDVIKFTVSVTNTNSNYSIFLARLFDTLPKEVRYAKGSTRINGANAPDPKISANGLSLEWSLGSLDPGQKLEVVYFVRVAANAKTGTKKNIAFAEGFSDAAQSVKVGSNTANAAFEIVKNLFSEKGIIIGKVFIDDNDNRIQDENELGLAGAKIYMQDGRFVVTDAEGKYHMDNVEPGTHVLKLDKSSLPKGAVPGIVDNRNMADAGSVFVDIFPGDLFKANFRVVPQIARPAVSLESGQIEGSLLVSRSIENILVDAGSGQALLVHTIALENRSKMPLYELVYKESSPYLPERGTVTMDGAAFENPFGAGSSAFGWSLPLLAPGRGATIRFLSQIPGQGQDADATVKFMVEPAGKETAMEVQVPVSLALIAPQQYRAVVNFAFGNFELSDQARQSLASLAEHLRKTGFEKLVVETKGHADAVRVISDEKGYADNLELSGKRAKAVSDFLRERLIDLARVEFDQPQAEEVFAPQTSYGVFAGAFASKAQALDAGKALSQQTGFDAGIEEQVGQGRKKSYAVVLGPFAGQENARAVADTLPGGKARVLPVETAQSQKTTGQNQQAVFTQKAAGSSQPIEENRASLSGTPANRRVEVSVFAAGRRGVDAQIPIGAKLARGIYRLTVSFAANYPAEDLTDPALFLGLPQGLFVVGGTAKLGQKAVNPVREGDYYRISLEGQDLATPQAFEMDFIASTDANLEEAGVLVLAKTGKGRSIALVSNMENVGEVSKIRSIHQSANQDAQTGPALLDVQRLKEATPLGILSPEADMVLSGSSTRIRIATASDDKFELLVNARPVPEDRLASTTRDEALGVTIREYIGVALEEKANKIELFVNSKLLESRVIKLSGEVAAISHALWPERPPADGRTPAYVELFLLDKNGNPVIEDAFLEVSVDKGDIFDRETGAFKRFAQDPFKVKTTAGKAIVKLSPSSTTQVRNLVVSLGDKEHKIPVRFYPERREWILVGAVEGSVGFGDASQKGLEKDLDMPFDHSKGESRTQGRAAVFGKGAVGDVTMTLRYDTQKPSDDNTLLKQNTPGTNDESLYPVYGDESEQFFEAQSAHRLFLKAEKDLSYGQYGDFNTEMGSGLTYNRYSRTLTGGLVNLEKESAYSLKSFVSRNRQAVVREQIPGQGLSGPYFLGNSQLIVFSEKISIQTRDRNFPDKVLSERAMARYSDYDIDYDNGVIIFFAPVSAFDSDFNPQVINVIYETDNLEQPHHLYGARGELFFWGSRLKLGIMGVVEEHPIDDKQISGADIIFDDGKNIKITAEIAATSGYDPDGFDPASGTARRVEAQVRDVLGAQIKADYKIVDEGFENLSAATIEQGIESFGASASRKFGQAGSQTSLEAGFAGESSQFLDRKEANLRLDQQLGNRLSLYAGPKWARENTADSQDEER